METENIEKPVYDWQPLDQVIRGWVTMSNFQQDLEKYDELKHETEVNIIRGNN